MKRDLKQLFDEYVNEATFSACLRPETLRGYVNVFGLFFRIMPEVSSIDLLTPEMLNEFFKRIQTRQRRVGKNTLKTGVKKSTTKTYYSKLNAFFVWLEKKGHIDENPLRDIKPPKVTYDDFRRLEDSDIHKLYSAIALHSPNSLLQRRDTFMVSLLVYCGLRKGEFISLRASDVDMIGQKITVREETSKSKKSRTLCMHPTLALHLKDYLKERNTRGLKTEFLTVSNRGDRGLSREGLKHWVNGLIKKSDVKFHLHRFRHTFACKLVEKDVSTFKIQKMMGHTNIAMTMKYARSMRSEDMVDDIGKISF